MGTTNGQGAGSDGMSLLHTGDVADCFMRMDLCSYGKARRRFYDEVNLNPFKRYPRQVIRLVEWSFEDWLAFDCSIVGMTGGGMGGHHRAGLADGDAIGREMRFDLDHGARRDHMRVHAHGWKDANEGPSCDGPDPGMTPYQAVFELLNDAKRSELGPRAEEDVREVDETNFASMFWVRRSDAVTGRLVFQDLLHGGEYGVLCPPLAAEYDGARGGMIVNRIAKVRGAWRPCGIPVYEARRPDDPEVGDSLARFFREGGWKPDFPGMVRLFHGRSKGTGLDWGEMETLMNGA